MRPATRVRLLAWACSIDSDASPTTRRGHPPAGQPSRSQSTNFEADGVAFTVTISSYGVGREIPGLSGDQPTIPRGSDVDVVGESYYEDAFLRLTGGRCSDGFRAPCTARLVPEPDNQYDAMAVAVHIRDLKIGHLSREDARSYRPLVDDALRQFGVATVAATITGGWDRGDGDTGSFGVVLHFSSRPERPPEPRPNEIRLRTGGTVSVSNEEHYQSTLLAVTQGLDVRSRKYPVAAALHLVEANPHVKKSTGPVLEVRIGDSTVGYLTPAMSQRFARLAHRAVEEGKQLTAVGSIGSGTKAGTEIAEVTLAGVPLAQDEFIVIDDGIELIEDHVQSRKTGKVHRVRETLADGSRRTSCGTTIKGSDAVMLMSSKPWVGLVRPDSRELLQDGVSDRCERCE